MALACWLILSVLYPPGVLVSVARFGMQRSGLAAHPVARGDVRLTCC
jgi:hypothetical protein